MQSLLKLVVVGLAVFTLAACDGGSTRPDGEGPEVVDGLGGANSSGAGSNGTGSGTPFGANASGTGSGGSFTGHPLDNPEGALAIRTIYFDYDSSDVRQEYRGMLNEHAEFLATNSDAKVVVQGHGDERGTREYNVALGERRGQAVRRLLLFQGAAFDQVEVVSYGEESPVSFDHNEDSWSLNRRVELHYQGH